MRVIVAGSRTIKDLEVVARAIKDSGFKVTTVLSGGAAGVDQLGSMWAMEHGASYSVYAAQWNKFGRAAGPMRNMEMACSAQALVAVWDGKSRGTKNMIDCARLKGLKVYIHRTDKRLAYIHDTY